MASKTARKAVPFTNNDDDELIDTPLITAPSKRFRSASERKPTRLYRTDQEILEAAYKKAGIKIPNPSVNDPYTAIQKQMFEDAFNADATVKQAVLRKVQFTLGQHVKLSLEAVDESLDDKAKDALVNKPEYQQALNKLKEIDDNVHFIGGRPEGFHHMLKAGMTQASVFGRSALQIVYGKRKFSDGTEIDKLPIDMHILTSKYLGKVYVDYNTWELQGVVYITYDKNGNANNNQIKPEEMIYFTKNDYHVTPRTLFYGRSDIESVAHTSEMNRRLDEIDLKEIVTQLWAGFLEVKVNTRNRSVITNLIDQMDPGKVVGHNNDVVITPIDIPKDIPSLVDLRDKNDQRILRGLNVPSVIMNFENITNRATADDVLYAWQESTLEDEREWLRDTIEPQWYNRNLATILGVEQDQLPVRVHMEFETIMLDKWSDNVDGALKLWYAGVINKEKLLKLTRNDDEIKRLEQEDPKTLKEYYTQQDDMANDEEGDNDGDSPSDDGKDDEEAKKPLKPEDQQKPKQASKRKGMTKQQFAKEFNSSPKKN